MKRVVLTLTCALVPLHATPSDACSDEPDSAAAFPVLPAMGTTAPRNTRIWVPPPLDWFGPDLDPSMFTVTQDGTPVTFDPTYLFIDDEVGKTGLVFQPDAPLTAGASVVVQLGTEIITQFTVGPEEDVTPPGSPRVTRIDVTGGYYGGFSCGDSAHATVTVAANEELLLLSDDAGTVTTVPSFAKALGLGTRLTAMNLWDGEMKLQVLAFDLAGNVSRPSVKTFTVPTEQSGCATTRAAAAWPLVALAALGLRRRRGRQSP